MREMACALQVLWSKKRSWRRHQEDALVAAVWGAELSFFLATRQGRLGHCTAYSAEQPQRVEWRSMGRKVFALSWTPSFCGQVSTSGILICGLARGVVEVLNAYTMVTLHTLSATSAADTIGLSISPDNSGIWALYADKSMTYWASLPVPQAQWNMTSLARDFRNAQPLPWTGAASQVVTASGGKLHLWCVRRGKLDLEAQTESASLGVGEITALAVSSKLIACGHSSGIVRLMAISSSHLAPQEPMPERHSGDVQALSFGTWKYGGLQPLLLTSASRDRTAMVFSVRFGAAGLQAGPATATLLYRTQLHNLPLLRVALLVAEAPTVADSSSEVVRLAVCSTDQLVLRELELNDPSMVERRAYPRQAPRGTSWIGICADPARMLFFAACSDRRVLQLDKAGRSLQEVHFGGTALHMELTGPMQLSHDARFLAVGISGNGGVIIINVENGLQPIARMIAGQAEPPMGLVLLGHDELLSFWQDGTVLQWDVPCEEVPSIALGAVTVQPSQQSSCSTQGRRRRVASPRAFAITTGASKPTRGSIAGQGTFRGSPSRGRTSSRQGPKPVSVSGGYMRSPGARYGSPPVSSRTRYNRNSGPSSSVALSSATQITSEAEIVRVKENIYASISKAEIDREKVAATSPAEDCPNGILERLMASSPSPPRWAERPENGNGPAKDLKVCEEGVGDCLGKWARGSLVGAQVRSASDLHRVAPKPSASDMQARSASEGAQARSCRESAEIVIKRQLVFSSPVQLHPRPRPLPKRPSYPPPEVTLETCDATMTSVSSVSTALPAVESTSSSIIPALSHAVPEKGRSQALLSLPTPSRKGAEPAKPNGLREKLLQLQLCLQSASGSCDPQAEDLIRQCLEVVEGC